MSGKAAGSPCPQSWDPAVARRFRARTGLTHLGSGLDRDARGDLSFFAGVFVSADLLPFTVLNRLDCLRAEEISALAVSAISIPNRAATSLSSSTFAAPGVAFDSGRSCPALCDEFVFIHAAQHEKKLRLFVEPGANSIEHRRNMLAHAGPVRTAAGELDLARRRKQAVALPAHPIHDALG